jgi:hypothetical protein
MLKSLLISGFQYDDYILVRVSRTAGKLYFYLIMHFKFSEYKSIPFPLLPAPLNIRLPRGNSFIFLNFASYSRKISLFFSRSFLIRWFSWVSAIDEVSFSKFLLYVYSACSLGLASKWCSRPLIGCWPCQFSLIGCLEIVMQLLWLIVTLYTIQ